MTCKAAGPLADALASLVFILYALLCASTTAESAGDALRMMRKEDPSPSAALPVREVPATLQTVNIHSQEKLGSELGQTKEHSFHIANTAIGPQYTTKEIPIPTKVVSVSQPVVQPNARVPAQDASAAPQILPYSGAIQEPVYSDPLPSTGQQTKSSTPKPHILSTADRMKDALGKVAAVGKHPQFVNLDSHLMTPGSADSLARIGSAGQIHRSDEGFQGMARAAQQLILEEELEKAEKQHQASIAAGIVDPPHAEEPEEDGDKYDVNEDEDEEDRKRFGYHGPLLSTAPPTWQRPQRVPAPSPHT